MSDKKQPPGKLVRPAAAAWLILLSAVGVFLVLVIKYHPAETLRTFLDNTANSYIFAVLMAFLPILGFPISVFLVLVGMMFGIAGGIALTGLMMLFHLAATYYLVHSFLRSQVVRLLGRFNLKIPKLPQTGGYRLSLIFMIVPGLPYAVKNYLLALAGLPLKPYLLISWLTQFGASIPFVILGKGVMELDPVILIIALLVLLISFIVQYYLQQRYKVSDS